MKRLKFGCKFPSKWLSFQSQSTLSETAFDLLGPGATLAEGAQGALCDSVFEYGVRDALLYTIGGGTNEIQRTLIALRGLDLPR